MNLPSSRSINYLVFAGCTALMGIALFMEHAMGLEPCPLCILQRVTVIVTGLVTLVAALHHPGVRGIRVYAIGAILAAVLGAALAVRQLWLQSLPKDQVPACGPGLDYLMEVLPLTEVLNMILTGDGSCAEIAWTLFGISIPGWTLVGLIGLIAINVFQIVRPKI